MRMPGTSCSGSFAAVAIAPSAVPGEPVMYWLGAAVARRRDDDDAGLRRVRRGDGGRIVVRAERRAQRHVDDVHVVVDRPLDRVDGDVGRAVAAEHADRVDVGLRARRRDRRSSCCRRPSSRCTDRCRSCRSPSTPEPAAVPATCEPWPLQSSGFGSGCGIGWYVAESGSAL